MAATSTEIRRRAVVAALRAVADEPSARVAVGSHELARQVADALRRIATLEDAVFGADDADDDAEGASTPPVPPLSFGTTGMSPTAAQALFGD